MSVDSDLLQRQLLTLRIADLQSILQCFAYARNARKDELQKKVLELLNSRQTSLVQKANIKSQVNQSYSKIISIKNRSRSKSPEMYAQQYSSNPLVNTTLRTPTKDIIIINLKSFKAHGISPFNGVSSGFPIQPDVKLKKLAFYDILGTLLQPSTLVPSSQARQQEGTYYFHLTPQQATDIAMNRDLRNQSKPEYLIQVQLRFCLLETTCEQEDYFPPNVQLKVNGKMCQLPVSTE